LSKKFKRWFHRLRPSLKNPQHKSRRTSEWGGFEGEGSEVGAYLRGRIGQRMSRGSSIYFPGLNALRFWAAFAVIITHAELMKKYFRFDNVWIDPGSRIRTFAADHASSGEISWLSPIVAEAGPLGVVFFFVLSGYLITYLLLVEREKTGSVAVKSFYFRRILRIWPLYFFIFLLGFFVLPHIPWFFVKGQSEAFTEHFWGNFFCYLFIFPNLGLSLFPTVPNIGQSWSIGVEEQFYIIWPLLMLWWGRSWRVMAVFLIGLVGLKAGVLLYESLYRPDWIVPLKKFLAMSKMENMALGGLGAWAVFHVKKSGRLLPPGFTSNGSAWMAFSGILVLVYFSPQMVQDGIHLAHGLLFLFIIVNISERKPGQEVMENRVFNHLGKISYGIYMYHMMVIVLLLNIFRQLQPEGREMPWWGHASLYLLSVGLTIAVSSLSYRWLEHRFIVRKSKHSVVLSGENARRYG
jgi:peptidoglycan/LPS O-acetylase OafA/YrhL